MTKQKPIRYYLTYCWTLPSDLLAWAAILFIHCLWGRKLFWNEGLWCELKEQTLLTSIWNYGGVTLGHGGLLRCAGGKEIDTVTEFHEHVHVEQYEVSMLIAFVINLTIVMTLLAFNQTPIWWLSAILWVTGGLYSYLFSMLQAWLRGESAYFGSTFEESAYSQTKEWENDHD